MWSLVFQHEAAEFLRAQRGTSLQRLREFLENICAHPFAPADALCRGASGRMHEIRNSADFAVTYWVDILEKEIRIVEITRVR